VSWVSPLVHAGFPDTLSLESVRLPFAGSVTCSDRRGSPVCGIAGLGESGCIGMTLSENRWHSRRLSEYPWEQEALDYLRQGLPDRDPWHVWSDVEFIAGSGALYEIDAFVLSPSGLWVVEIKSDPGRMRGDHHFWHFFHEGRTKTIGPSPGRP